MVFAPNQRFKSQVTLRFLTPISFRFAIGNDWGFVPNPGNVHSRLRLLAVSNFRHADSRTAGAWLQFPGRELSFLHLPFRFAAV